MKSGILKLMLLSIPLVPLLVHAADDAAPQTPTQVEAAQPTTFSSGESEPAGVDAKLSPSSPIQDGAANTAASPAPAPNETAAASPPPAPASADSDTQSAKTSTKSSKKSSSRSSARAKTKTAKAHARHPSTIMDTTPGDQGTMPAMTSTIVETPPVAQAPLALDTKSTWKIRSGERISEVFVRWTKAVGWQLSWEPEDMVALADLELEDTFTGVTGKVIDALNRNGADIQAKFYASNHMLRIMARK